MSTSISKLMRERQIGYNEAYRLLHGDGGAHCAGATGSGRVCENCNNAPATHSAHYIESPVQGFFCERCVAIVGRDRLLLGPARPLRGPNNPVSETAKPDSLERAG